MRIFTRRQAREVDRRAIQEYGMSGLVLMENAGRGAVDLLCGLMKANNAVGQERVTVICGKGSNGGDGCMMARHLQIRCVPVNVLLLANPAELTGDAAANFAIIQKSGLPIETFGAPLDEQRFNAAIAGSTWLVDAILGTGATGEPKPPLAEAIGRMNASGIPILAVDVPSGLDCDTGQAAAHTIRAKHTCTFVAAKPGLLATGAHQYVGQLHILHIGAPRRVIEEVERSEC